MTEQQGMIRGIRERGKQKKGMAHLVHYLEGKRLTQRQSIHAFCYHCCGYGEVEDCLVATCPLYPYAPYSSKKRVIPAKRKKL